MNANALNTHEAANDVFSHDGLPSLKALTTLPYGVTDAA